MSNVILELVRSRTGTRLKKLFWYPLKRLWYPLVVEWGRHRGAMPVLVYQMGKVASMSVAASLSRVPGLQVFHLHFLAPDNLRRCESSLRALTGERDVAYLFDLGTALHDQIIRPGRPAKIVTLVREPIGRNVSGYFHDLDRWWGSLRAHEKVPMERLVERFRSDFPHDQALRWFDDELRASTGIDIYAHPFPRELGYLRFRHGVLDVLVMRHDLDDELKARVLGEWVGGGPVDIVRRNTATQKPYRESYRRFCAALHLDREYVDTMLGSRYARHFYSAEELDMLRRKWLQDDAAARER